MRGIWANTITRTNHALFRLEKLYTSETIPPPVGSVVASVHEGKVSRPYAESALAIATIAAAVSGVHSTVNYASNQPSAKKEEKLNQEKNKKKRLRRASKQLYIAHSSATATAVVSFTKPAKGEG